MNLILMRLLKFIETKLNTTVSYGYYNAKSKEFLVQNV